MNIHLILMSCCFLLFMQATNSAASQSLELQLNYGQSVTTAVETTTDIQFIDYHEIEITYTLIRGENEKPDQILVNLYRSGYYSELGRLRGLHYLFVFDKDRGINELTDMGFRIGRSFESGYVKRFFRTPNNQDVLSLADPFQSGYAAFREAPQRGGIKDFIYLNLDPAFTETTLDIELIIYFGDSSTRINGLFFPINHQLRMPDDMFPDLVIDCEELLREHRTRIDEIIPGLSDKDIFGNVNNAIRSDQVSRMKGALEQVIQYQIGARQLEEIKSDLLELDVPSDCNKARELLLDDIRPIMDKKQALEESQQRLTGHIQLIEKCRQLLERHMASLQKKNTAIRQENNEAIRLIEKYATLLYLLKDASDREKASYNIELSDNLSGITVSLEKLRKMHEDLGAMRQDLGSLDMPDCQPQISTIKQQIDSIEEEIKKLIAQLKDLQDLINNGLAITDSERVIQIQELKRIYEPEFTRVHGQLQNVEASLVRLREEFQAKREKESFSRRARNTLKTELEQLNTDLDSLKAQFEHVLAQLKAQVYDNLENDTYRSAGIATTHIDNNHATINILFDKIKRMRQELNTAPLDERPYLIILAGALVLVIIIYGAWVYFKALKKNRLKNKINKAKLTNKENMLELDSQYSKQHKSAKVGGITIKPKYSDKNIQELANKGRGIDHAKSREGLDYYMIDLGDFWEDTVVRRVYINQHAIVKTYKFFYESCVEDGKVLETGGYLIGFWDYNPEQPGSYDVALEDFIEPGDDAIRGEYQLNFGAKIGVRLDQTIKNHRDKTGRDMLLLAWFHSHPGMKIFLSNHDLALQNQLTSEVHRQKLLALVIDPNTQENDKMVFNAGIFSYRSDGLMNNNDGGMKLVSWKTLYSWAMAPKVPRLDQFFYINLETFFAKTAIHQLFFSDKSIIRFTLFLDEILNQNDAIGYFAGNVICDHYRDKCMAIIKDFYTEMPDQPSDDDNHVIGCFISGQIPKDDRWQQKYLPYKDIHFAMFCNNKEEGLLILTRQPSTVYNSAHHVKARINIHKLESWPTRRR